MGYEDLDPKYLDPAANPMIPGSDLPAFEKKPDPPNKYTDPSYNKMIDARVETGSIVEGEILAGKIGAAFPTENKIDLAGFTIVRMADGSFTIGSKPLAQVSPEILLRISWALDEKK